MCVLGGAGGQKGVFVSSGKSQTNHYMEQRGKSKVEATGASAAAWAALLVHYLRRLRRL